MDLSAPAGTLRSSFQSALVAAFGFALSVLVFYPGIFTPDSLVQFDQAQSGQFSDWHPPAMAALWRLFIFIHRGPELLFLFHLALFWSGAFALSDALAQRGARWAIWLPLFGLAPFVFNYLGLLWKDVALASSWFFAITWTFHARSLGRRAHISERSAIWLVFLYGALVRTNSIFAAAPLALYLINGDVLSKRIWPQLAACILTPALLLISAQIVNNDLLRAQHEHAEDSIMLFDLAGMSHAQHRNLIPGPWTPDQARRIPNCYHPDKWDWLGEGDCAFIGDAYDNNNLWGSASVADAWRAAIFAHPTDYLAHRLAFTNQILRIAGPLPAHDSWMNSEITDPRYAHHPSPIFHAYEDLGESLDSTPLFRPFYWLILSCTLFAVSFWRPDTPARRFASALSASAIIYLLTYVLFGVASDFRYAYWSICAAIAAFAALVCVKSAALESASPRVSRIKQCAENFVRRVRDRRTTLESTAWYLAIGVFNAIFYVLLGKALVTLGLGPSAAGILAFLPCAALSYLGHKYKTFRSSGAHRREAPRFALLFVIGVFCSAALPKLAQLAGLPVFWAFASVSAAVPVLNLIVMRYWIFGADT